MNRRAFTLVEMTVVLAIIALFAHVAIRQLGRMDDARRAKAADRQLEEIALSVYSPPPPGGESSGFLADMGRLPAPDGDKTNEWTLCELWRMPSSAAPYALREATNGNFAAGVDAAALAEKGVFVPTGWRGPYLRLPLGRDELLDPWGNQMTRLDDAGLVRLDFTNGVFTAASHYGASGQPRDRRTASLVPDGGAASRLVVSFVSAGASSGTVKCKWFGPASGLITGNVATVSYPGTKVFEGLTPGLRVFHDDVSKAARYVDVKPGDNALEVKLP